MATWDRILQQRELVTRLRQEYNKGPTFPIEVRHALAPWIEEHFSANSHLDPRDSNDNDRIKDLMWNMAVEMDRKIMPGSICPTFDNRDISNILRQCISDIRIGCPDSAILFLHIKKCLEVEVQLLNGQPPLSRLSLRSPSNGSEAAEFQRALENFQTHNLTELGLLYERMQTSQATLTSILHNFGYGPPQTEGNELQRTRNELGAIEQELHTHTQTCVHELAVLLQGALRVARQWKDEMKLNYEGKSERVSVPLDHVAQLVNKLARFMWSVLDIVRNVIVTLSNVVDILSAVSPSSSPEVVNTALFEIFKAEVEELLRKLVFHTCIVRVQPYQMLKADTRFCTTVQFFVGDQAPSLPRIKISLLTDRQASALQADFGNMHMEVAALREERERLMMAPQESLIDGDFATLEVTDDQQCCASFKNPKIKKTFKRVIEREVREVSRSVLDVNYFIYYSGQFEVNGITFNIGALSCPVKVITNGSQEQKSWETSIWDLATGALAPGQSVGQKPTAPWEDVSKALNVCFLRQTGRGLSKENVDFIVQTLLPIHLSRLIQGDPLTHITLEHFCMEPIESGRRNFTLWEWLFGVMKLITEHLRGTKRPGRQQSGIWDQGLVMGLVTAEKSRNLLKLFRNEMPNGFVLRFSPNVLNTITIEWIETGNALSASYQPLDNNYSCDVPTLDRIRCTRTTRKDLMQRSLADRLLDVPRWQELYTVDEIPVPKCEVFKRSTRQESLPPPREVVLPTGTVIVEYVSNVLRTHLLTNQQHLQE